jgi:hypothetical protein
VGEHRESASFGIFPAAGEVRLVSTIHYSDMIGQVDIPAGTVWDFPARCAIAETSSAGRDNLIVAHQYTRRSTMKSNRLMGVAP